MILNVLSTIIDSHINNGEIYHMTNYCIMLKIFFNLLCFNFLSLSGILCKFTFIKDTFKFINMYR